jgi:SAM-dependent methyltransferase
VPDRGGRLPEILQGPVKSARIYDLVQHFAGDRRLLARLTPHLDGLPSNALLVDLGGGTGLMRRGSSATYVCVDLDLDKLRRFRRGRSNGLAVVADAGACPFPTARCDVVLCAKVVHHLDDSVLRATLSEAARILKSDGTLILVDAIRSNRWMPRLLWRLDRGSFPRSANEIRTAVAADFRILDWDQFRLAPFHDIVLCTARRATAISKDGTERGQPSARGKL